MEVDNNWDEYFAFDSKTPELPAPKQSVVASKKPIATTRKPTPISPVHRRRSNLRDYHVTPSTTDDDDWDKDFEGGLTLRSPQVAPAVIPSLPPLSPKKFSPRKLSPPKPSTGNVSDDNSRTIRPAALRTSQSRKVSAESSTSSNGNTMRAVNSPTQSETKRKPVTKPPAVIKKRPKYKRFATQGDLSDDSYEDLIMDNESKFVMKVNSLKVFCDRCG